MSHSYCNNENKKKKKKPELNSMMDSLPVEILIDILLRLLVNSVCCIRCVSKALLKTVDYLSFATLHMRRLFFNTSCSTTPEVPQLVLLIDSPFIQMHPLQYNGKDLIKSKHAIVSDYRLRQRYYYYPAFVFCNLFGFKDIYFHLKYGRLCFLLNPFKGEFLGLPIPSDVQVSANSSFLDDWYGMGFETITNTYKIVRISCQKKKGFKTHMATQVLVLGTSSWQELSSIPPSCLTYKSAYAHGDMYWLVIEDDNVLSFDFKKEEFYWTPCPVALEKKRHLWKFLHLLNFKRSLVLVEFSSSKVKYMKVWGLKNNYDNKKEWVLNYKIDTQQYNLPQRKL